MPDAPPKNATCGTCAWGHLEAGVRTCVAQSVGDSPGPVVRDTMPSCPMYEPEGALACQECGACCREGYDSVPINDRDRMRLGRENDSRVRVHSDGWTDLHRTPTPTGTRCVALKDDPASGCYFCDMYTVRPDTCRDLAAGSTGCLTARRRVGLSRTP